jgi:glycosyltransferase involved in cell wall biosynthesis
VDQRFDPDRIDLERVAALRAEFGLPAGGLVVGAVGRLVAGKGYGELFSAARAVRCRHPEVRILVVSSPDLDKADAIGQDELTRAAADVLVTGWRDDVRDLLAVMDVFVLASWREGMPRSAIEPRPSTGSPCSTWSTTCWASGSSRSSPHPDQGASVT